MNKISIVIPTKDRLSLLKNTLKNLDKNNFFFNEIIIIDSSSKKICKYNYNFLSQKIKRKIKLIYSSPGTSLQRNIGLKSINKNNDYVMFLDDDIICEKRAFLKIHYFLDSIPNYILGISLNNSEILKNNFFENLKKSKIFSFFHLYSARPGIVTKSGWQTKNTKVNYNIFVEWISTAAALYRIKKIKNLKFNKKLGVYSYLEDLDFSYKVSKIGKLMIFSKSTYFTKNVILRNNFQFGTKEILNRYIFIKDNNLSKFHFFLGSFFLILKNLLGIILLDITSFNRGLGNIIGYIRILKNG